jgi:hypothetical protein
MHNFRADNIRPVRKRAEAIADIPNGLIAKRTMTGTLNPRADNTIPSTGAQTIGFFNECQISNDICKNFLPLISPRYLDFSRSKINKQNGVTKMEPLDMAMATLSAVE